MIRPQWTAVQPMERSAGSRIGTTGASASGVERSHATRTGCEGLGVADAALRAAEAGLRLDRLEVDRARTQHL